MIPRVDIHGVWVAEVGSTQYGRVGHVERDQEAFAFADGAFDILPTEVRVWVVWENSKGNKNRDASFRLPSELRVLPVEPEPWYKEYRSAWLRAKRWVKENLP